MLNSNVSRIRHHRIVVFSLLSLLVMMLVLPLVPYAVAELDPFAGKVANPGAEFWRDVRQRDRSVTGTTQVKGVDTDVLINTFGGKWAMMFRAKVLVPVGAALMGIVLSIILLFYLLRGPLRIQGGPAGSQMQRFSATERTVHWFTAGLFWFLALTGLILLYGRFVLIPLLGPDGFSVTASACKEAHNLFGPLFLIALLMLFIIFVKDNFFARGDMKWLLKGGGLLGGHVSAGRFNAGEKIWFWIAVLGGIVLCVSGLILDFAVFGQGRTVMVVSILLHAIVALIVIAVSFGHIYLGTAGVEGTLGAMTHGYVDLNWARSHHDRWARDVEEAGGVLTAEEAARRQGKLSAGQASGKPVTGESQ